MKTHMQSYVRCEKPAALLQVSLSFTLILMATATHAAPVFNPDNGHSYEIVQEGKTWADAQAAAASMGCHLATITSQAENDFVSAQLLSNLPPEIEGVWIGGQQKVPCNGPGLMDNTAKWGKWVTGEPWLYTNWEIEGTDKNPDDCTENCLMYESGAWDDEDCAKGDGSGNDGDKIWYLEECDPVQAPALSHAVLIVLSLLMAVSGLCILKRRSMRTR
jgi:hypothetical protein